MSGMAATLFALVGIRNAAPGGPPIGSLIDCIAFFWAEAIIATDGRRTHPVRCHTASYDPGRRAHDAKRILIDSLKSSRLGFRQQ
ncbi:DUF4436 family protein [Kitasatospora sp. NPDC058048]|uniref:DUF4436 family protein n=1 Tax=Kitasatospora sp. NPDC058048 TaxID=3346313 RepID=UPI0036D7E8DE